MNDKDYTKYRKDIQIAKKIKEDQEIDTLAEIYGRYCEIFNEAKEELLVRLKELEPKSAYDYMNSQQTASHSSVVSLLGRFLNRIRPEDKS